jgi:broad specificity phosphatase PhoE
LSDRNSLSGRQPKSYFNTDGPQADVKAVLDPIPLHWTRMIPQRPFYFLRHGQTDWNREGRYQGTSDIALNAVGIAQARAAAAWLARVKLDRVIASPLIRALKTAAIVAEQCPAPIHIDIGLVERNFGSFEGLIIRDVKERHGMPLDQPSTSIMPADADPWHEIFERVPPIIARWLNTFPGEALLFVAHGGVFDALHRHIVGPRVGAESKHATPYLARPSPNGWTLLPVDEQADEQADEGE